MRKNTERSPAGCSTSGATAARARAPPTTATPRSCASRDAGLKKVYACSVFETCGPDALSQGRHARLHADRTRATPISSDWCCSIRDAATRSWSRRTRRSASISATPCSRRRRTNSSRRRTRTSATRIYFRDKAFKADYKWCRSKLPGKDIDFGVVDGGRTAWLVAASSDTEPGERLPLRSRHQETHAPVPGAREAAARAARADDRRSATRRRTAWRFRHI